ncbi:TetR/AcrR family transcriptional regulator [Anaerosacchariphilus polymeriproducens]|uniref:TetR/AcrR family transcriptional regulator n=1 Tax=Anaerosacchariphilus polymeriproducens TaxID=1812858 RepID=A0A371AVR8_9FIRM|nr:TetR/AcrR family transcriptional regulator [Anaerosacchariphilus polymeriproducens]RDU23631.1 TetR/AcrR family transcriptional regulator [Anaerosacchariphilus polymeriproducens]
MRVIKKHDERKNEILDAAERLFHVKGYEKCTVNDILEEVAIAKGTFYYYFKSKKEVMEAVVSRYTDVVAERANKILKNDKISTEEKLVCIFRAMKINDQIDSDVLNEMHKAENAQLHQKILNQMVTTMAPILVQVVEEGVERKIWSCKYPLQYMQIFLSAALTLTDEGIFKLDKEEQGMLMTALISLIEKMLEVPENSFNQLFIQKWEKT